MASWNPGARVKQLTISQWMPIECIQNEFQLYNTEYSALIHGPVNGVRKVAKGIGVDMQTPSNGLHWCQYVVGRRNFFACKKLFGSRKIYLLFFRGLAYSFGILSDLKTWYSFDWLKLHNWRTRKPVHPGRRWYRHRQRACKISAHPYIVIGGHCASCGVCESPRFLRDQIGDHIGTFVVFLSHLQVQEAFTSYAIL